ncbi:MAG: GGDEF domain-containing protein [Eubacteriales bacterium]
MRKNRNAYEVDLNNLIVRGKSEMVGVIVADINGVKEVNDRLGHSAGDDYIRMVADVIRENKTSTMVAYRTGGDEFSIFIQDAELEEMKNFVETCIYQVKHQKKFSNMRCSLACGYTIFDSEQDKTLNDTYKRADDLMYAEKRRQKEAEER